jgi:hypothetical protein
MSLRDMHRVAQVLLDHGRGIVPAWFVDEMSRKHIETLLQTNEEERYGYGWQCWRTRAGFAMYGMGGQLAILCPDRGALLSTIADTRLDPFGVQRIYNAFFEEIYPYIGEEDMDAEKLHLRVPAVPDRPEFALEETGLYTFGENPLGLRSLQLKRDCLLYENARGAVRLPFARGGSLEIVYPGWEDVPALSSGGWVDRNVLRIRCFAVGDAPCGFDMLVCFREKAVTVQCRKSSDPVTEGYEGVASGTRA